MQTYNRYQQTSTYTIYTCKPHIANGTVLFRTTLQRPANGTNPHKSRYRENASS
jgi:hypothetical protein